MHKREVILYKNTAMEITKDRVLQGVQQLSKSGHLSLRFVLSHIRSAPVFIYEFELPDLDIQQMIDKVDESSEGALFSIRFDRIQEYTRNGHYVHLIVLYNDCLYEFRDDEFAGRSLTLYTYQDAYSHAGAPDAPELTRLVLMLELLSKNQSV